MKIYIRVYFYFLILTKVVLPLNKYLFKLTHFSLLQFFILFLRKLSFKNQQICTLLKKFSLQNKKLPSYEQAIQYLNSLSPDSKSSALKKQISEDDNSNYDLKIIVSTYNAANTIEDCIESILNQKTKYSLLIEVINDGSTDATKQILEQYTNRSNVVIINQENQGFSGARNTGLTKINANYLCFVDSDDILEDCFAEVLLDTAFTEQADIVAGGYQQFDNSGIIHEFNYQDNNRFDPYKLYGYPWGKIYHAALFNTVIFPENYWFEDTMLSYLVYDQSHVVCTVKETVYRYRSNQNGITAFAPTKPKAIDSLWVTQQLLLDRKNLKLAFNDEIYKVTLRQTCTNFIRCRFLGNQVQKAVFVVQQQIINDYFKNFALKDDSYLKIIEKAIKADDYLTFVVHAYLNNY